MGDSGITKICDHRYLEEKLKMENMIEMLQMPDRISILTEQESRQKGDTSKTGDAEVFLVSAKGQLDVYLEAFNTPVREIVLYFSGLNVGTGSVLSDHWERAYGDLFWKEKEQCGVMPWYFIEDRKNYCFACGVKVRPGAMCWWEIKGDELVLHLDVRCGGAGVLLKGRRLLAASLLMKRYDTKDTFVAAQHFCRCMCQDSCYDNSPIYGSNNWYYAYGNSSAEDILADSAYLAMLTEGNSVRPFMVVDDGWQERHSNCYNGGPWGKGNRKFGDMGELAAKMKRYDIRPGLWFRPLLDSSAHIPAEWRLSRDSMVLDISVPEVLAHVQKDIERMKDWGFELIKHDFSTFDLLGKWGFQMAGSLTEEGWRFWDTSRTTAEIITEFYRSIRNAAGNMLILGCNCIGHLGAGLMQLNRTGDDTSGTDWERTKKMGVNTLAFRMPQHGAFFGVDADCVGITEHISWEKNRQWMELLSASRTPFFVSVKSGTLNKEQEEELRSAYRRAAENGRSSIPLDWKENRVPRKWLTCEGIRNFSWDEE